MAIKLGAAGLAVVVLAVLLQGCFFSGGGGSSLSTVARSSAIPTATPPVTLPEPILLGQASNSGPGSATTSSASPGTYTVKTGDTLGAIATANNVPPEQQAAWIVEVLRLNAIDDARLLKAGQDLQLPRLPTPVPTRTTPTSGTPSASGTARPGTPTATRPPGTPSSGPGATSTPTPRSSTSGGSNTYTVQSGDIPGRSRRSWACRRVSRPNG